MPDPNKAFTFIDLFAGIGGIRLAFEQAGCKCVFSCEYDRHCQETYRENFGETPYGDIREIDAASVPDHDILAGGFPCPAFSRAGVSSRNYYGIAHGFQDKTQGTLFFNVKDILKAKRPKMFLLENVKSLRSYDGGNAFKTIMAVLQDELDYNVSYQIIDARRWVPQHRERIFLIGLRRDIFGDFGKFDFPSLPPGLGPKMGSILEKNADPKFGISDKNWECLKRHAERHKAKGHGFGYGLVNGRSVARTLSHRYYKDGLEILVERPGMNPRMLTPDECRKLMGFPEGFKITPSKNEAYRQFGNSVVVPVVAHLAKAMVSHLGRILASKCEQP